MVDSVVERCVEEPGKQTPDETGRTRGHLLQLERDLSRLPPAAAFADSVEVNLECFSTSSFSSWCPHAIISTENLDYSGPQKLGLRGERCRKTTAPVENRKVSLKFVAVGVNVCVVDSEPRMCSKDGKLELHLG
ncbi:predicted protein [Histoplasma capsulatum var. duboisii H88]|uniref:Predicted protein n=1 Tax=Ajellomyces capsulatus (strain H88) TaxID=544711 RepID=F0UP21_AJEC8|nr:predicted protein [Histoplasma capsulatum var. duboisii H88]